MTTVGVVLFPGSNCEQDAIEAVTLLGGEARVLWHGDATVAGVDAVIIPGGFAHGDALRPGAIARFSPVMGSVAEFARQGGPVVGICNGFQVLTEAGLLPGALQKNRGLTFLCTTVALRVETTDSVLTSATSVGDMLRVPINHFEGNYTCGPETLAELRAEDRIVLRYVDNPNGSMDDIAGICNEGRNVVGLMPHPERAISDLLGSTDGLGLLRSSAGGVPRRRLHARQRRRSGPSSGRVERDPVDALDLELGDGEPVLRGGPRLVVLDVVVRCRDLGSAVSASMAGSWPRRWAVSTGVVVRLHEPVHGLLRRERPAEQVSLHHVHVELAQPIEVLVSNT